jgi:hypothetical protein
VIGRVEVLVAKMRRGRTASSAARGLGLDLRVLEHRLDDQVAALEAA